MRVAVAVERCKSPRGPSPKRQTGNDDDDDDDDDYDDDDDEEGTDTDGGVSGTPSSSGALMQFHRPTDVVGVVVGVKSMKAPLHESETHRRTATDIARPYPAPKSFSIGNGKTR